MDLPSHRTYTATPSRILGHCADAPRWVPFLWALIQVLVLIISYVPSPPNDGGDARSRAAGVTPLSQQSCSVPTSVVCIGLATSPTLVLPLIIGSNGLDDGYDPCGTRVARRQGGFQPSAMSRRQRWVATTRVWAHPEVAEQAVPLRRACRI